MKKPSPHSYLNFDKTYISVLIIFLSIKHHFVQSTSVKKCYDKSPLNLSNDICGDLCERGMACSRESGACVCNREPTPTNIGGHFTHCTNWNYVDQSECKGMCIEEAKNDSRVCWTFTVGNYCVCF